MNEAKNKLRAKRSELMLKVKALDIQIEKQLQKEHLPEFKKLEGRFFKKKNSYGTGKEWWLYTKVVRILRKDLYWSGENVLATYTGIEFQTCVHGITTIEYAHHGYCHSLGKEIPESEYNAALAKIKNKLKLL